MSCVRNDWKGQNGSGMHVKTTGIRYSKSGQTISRHPAVRQIDGERFNILRYGDARRGMHYNASPNVTIKVFQVNGPLAFAILFMPAFVGLDSWKQMRIVMLRKQQHNRNERNGSESSNC